MAVHQITNSYSQHAGGAEKLVRDLHQELLSQDYDSRLVGLERQLDETISQGISLNCPSVYHPTALWRLLRYIRRNVGPADTLHVHLFPSIFYVALIKTLGLTRARLVMTEHSTSNKRRNTLWGALTDRLTYRAYARIFAISEGVRTALLNWQKQLAGRVSVVYNGARLPYNEPRHKSANDKLVILSVGNLRPAKNYPAMLTAYARLARPNTEYWIAGDGPLRQELSALAGQLGIGEQVRFLGHVTPLRETLENADVFLMASLWEGFGLAAVEAMNASLPLVISDIPGLKEVDDPHNRCAIKIDPRASDSITQGLQQLLEDPARRSSMGQAAWARSREFSLQRMVKSYRDEYDALAHSH